MPTHQLVSFKNYLREYPIENNFHENENEKKYIKNNN